MVMASAIAWRVSYRPMAPGLAEIAIWQLIVWAPWAGYYYAIRWLGHWVGFDQIATRFMLVVYMTAMLAVASSHLVWYWQVSSYISPFLGLPETRFGVYAFFFVFWVLIDLALFAAVFAFLQRPGVQGSESNVAVTDHFVVRSGRSEHLIRSSDIRWIEAQGAYAGLHTGEGTFLLRRSMARLEKELDSGRFIRIHRSTIVNIGQVNGLKRDGSGAISVLMSDGSCRRVSRSGQRKLKQALSSAT